MGAIYQVTEKWAKYYFITCPISFSKRGGFVKGDMYFVLHKKARKTRQHEERPLSKTIFKVHRNGPDILIVSCFYKYFTFFNIKIFLVKCTFKVQIYAQNSDHLSGE